MSKLALVAVEPKSEAFVEAIQGAAKSGAATLAVLPEGDLARAIFGSVRNLSPLRRDRRIFCV